MDKCKTCKFLFLTSVGNVGGECRRFPPVVSAFNTPNGEVDWSTDWPWVGVGSWCGEHSEVVEPTLCTICDAVAPAPGYECQACGVKRPVDGEG